jgi:hypothetical protein
MFLDECGLNHNQSGLSSAIDLPAQPETGKASGAVND